MLETAAGGLSECGRCPPLLAAFTAPARQTYHSLVVILAIIIIISSGRVHPLCQALS